jgi:hypothetical protein
MKLYMWGARGGFFVVVGILVVLQRSNLTLQYCLIAERNEAADEAAHENAKVSR